ncbi:MAG: hypothetical protein QE271_01555 [Bacteriovoracaceae bacterium]|nr:hypothetical protein [Bacteriovoracaceae bacterium]
MKLYEFILDSLSSMNDSLNELKMIKCWIIICTLFVLVGCAPPSIGNKASIEIDRTVAGFGASIEDPNSVTPTPTSTPTGPTPTPTSSGNGNPGGNGQPGEIPITLIFLKTNTEQLTSNVQADAESAIAKFNEKFLVNGVQTVKFYLYEAKEILDAVYFRTNCNLLGSVGQKYGDDQSQKMIFVNDLAGGCAGVSYVNSYFKITPKYAITMCEYAPYFDNNNETAMVHEFAHSFGVNHTANIYPGSVPGTGRRPHNEYLDLTSISSRRCQSSLMYYIHTGPGSTNATADGIIYDSFLNSLYPSYGGQSDNGFFTAGYNVDTKSIFECWNEYAQGDL